MASISKRVNGSWVSGDERVMKTATDTITTLPADLYADGNNATVGLEGNMVQSGTPTPTNPIQPSECGDLETSGEHSGQYKIPISSANTTTPVYLGEVQTTRKIKKLVLTGEESWAKSTDYNTYYLTNISDYMHVQEIITVCSHFIGIKNQGGIAGVTNGTICFNFGINRLYIHDERITTLEAWQEYLRNQYSAGTPVTVWYVLAEPTTGIVNEPIRKIGDYADTVSGITIPTITGKDIIDVDTTLKPSAVSLNYTGWHVGTVHERESGSWD